MASQGEAAQLVALMALILHQLRKLSIQASHPLPPLQSTCSFLPPIPIVSCYCPALQLAIVVAFSLNSDRGNYFPLLNNKILVQDLQAARSTSGVDTLMPTRRACRPSLPPGLKAPEPLAYPVLCKAKPMLEYIT
ncbi:hypothetical protein EJB05_12717, partial [Eragrostis curvula]